jgi:hypothetical protein
MRRSYHRYSKAISGNSQGEIVRSPQVSLQGKRDAAYYPSTQMSEQTGDTNGSAFNERINDLSLVV